MIHMDYEFTILHRVVRFATQSAIRYAISGLTAGECNTPIICRAYISIHGIREKPGVGWSSWIVAGAEFLPYEQEDRERDI